MPIVAGMVPPIMPPLPMLPPTAAHATVEHAISVGAAPARRGRP